MKESEFIKKNEEKWKRLEHLVNFKANPDELVSLFIKATGDLAYARTHYPRRSVRIYLNNLVNNVSEKIRTKKSYTFLEKALRFYSYTIPSIVVDQWKSFVVALLVFVASMMIGVFSLLEHPDFAKEILGSSYVSITEQNISNDDPMAIYKDANKSEMFLGITVKNIKVAFLTFVLGIFSVFGTVMILIKNGIMVGVFQTFFYQKDLFLESFLTIWIHGAIEISSIIIAGAAGIILGNSLFFRGTYSNGVALRNGAVKSLFVLLSTVPLFVIAGFFEGFVTRLTEMPVGAKWMIILLSFSLIAFIYIILPLLHWKKYGKQEVIFVSVESDSNYEVSDKNVVESSLVDLSQKFFELFYRVVVPFTILFGAFAYCFLKFNLETFDALIVNDIFAYPKLFYIWPLLIFVLVLVFFFASLAVLFNNQKVSFRSVFKTIQSSPLVFFITAIAFALTLINANWWAICLFVLLFPMGAMSYNMIASAKGRIRFSDLIKTLKADVKYFVSMFIKRLIITVVFLLINVLIFSTIGSLFTELLSFVTFFESFHIQSIFVNLIIAIPINILILSFYTSVMNFEYIKQDRYRNAKDIYDVVDQLSTIKA